MLDAPVPNRVVVENEGGTLVIRFRWFTSYYLFMAAFCVFWDGFLVFWYRTALSAANPEPVMVLFPLLHVGVGIGLTYSTLAGFFNHTMVRAGQGKLSVRHGPLPWWGAEDLGTGEIQQIYLEERGSQGSRGGVSYRLNVMLRTGRKRTLLNSREKDVPLYVEQRLERHLGIEDVHVPGEVLK